jgi:ADP-ribosylglycohydrolase
MPVPSDYLERVYAGVLGKLIGVYVGRPFEGWTHQRVLKELGHVQYYVHEKFDAPLVVTDDDVSGTFVFIRALQEHGISPDLTSEQIGKTWLNNIIENRAIFWWGGNGISTEHTAYINLKKRGIPAPLSGSIKTNGQTVAEQIGAQIFIDGWAMLAPGNPALAARFAEAAGSVSHDGESVHAAKLLAAMEAEAFVSKDVDHLLDVGLGFVPSNSRIARLVSDIRGWVKIDRNWETTRDRIEDIYGYDKFCGICHVIPNHALIIMALLYAGDNFHEAMHIINTCGWDTDCNSGNLGSLVAIMHGLKAFDGGPDWRGPLADRALISSADAGYSINNAARITYDIVNTGRQLAGEAALPAPKDGAHFHFTLPGSVQGFHASPDQLLAGLVKIEQGVDKSNRTGLAIRLRGVTDAVDPVEVLTQTFTPQEVKKMKTYELMASPLVYPGQTVRAVVRAEMSNTASVDVRLRFKSYDENNRFTVHDGQIYTIQPGQETTVEMLIVDDLDGQPIQQLGLALSTSNKHLDGTVWVDRLTWTGLPAMVLKVPEKGGDFWHRAWVNAISTFRDLFGPLYAAQDSGEGIAIYGTREWTDYRAVAHRFIVNLGSAGVAARVQGLNRYYALVFMAGGRIALIKARDELRTILASGEFDWKVDTPYQVVISTRGSSINGSIDGGPTLTATDDEYTGGGIGLVVTEGSISVKHITLTPAE